MKRRALLGALLAMPAVARATPAARIDLLVGAAPGSAPDLWARGIAPFLERALPRLSIAVRNHPGRGGLEGLAELLARPDNAKIAGVFTSPTLLVRAIEAAEASPLDRVTPVAALVEEAVVLVAGATGPSDLAELRALGDRATIGTSPPGTAAHVASLRLDGKLDLPRLAFPSAAAARQAAIGGHVAAAIVGLPEALASLRDGRLIGLGIASGRRSALLPDLATLREQGLDLVAAVQRGLVVPPNAAASWRAALSSAMEAVAADADFAAQCAARGQAPRFHAAEIWGRQLARVDQELRGLWQQDPWLPRRS